MKALRNRMVVTPITIARADPDELLALLRPAGLARQKVPKIQGLARALSCGKGLRLEAIARLPRARAREVLTGLPGIGPKTADVWLSLVAGKTTMPVDTHIWRLATRWHLARGTSYDEVSSNLADLIPPTRRGQDHLVLIEFGREICQARKPHCGVCPVYDLCDADVKMPRPNLPPRDSRSQFSGSGGRKPLRSHP